MKKILKSIRGSGSGSENKERKDKTKGGNSKQSTHSKDGPNPLCAAAFSGDIDKASECIKHIGVNSLDEKLGKAPLHFAARGGHLQMIKFLIDEGADPNLLCSDKRTPLFSAIEGAHESSASWLINKGHCTDKQDSTGSTVLHFAAYYGLPQNFRKIYTVHPHLISVYDQAGMMPIHVAVQATRDEIANYICTVHPESCEAKTKVHEQTALMLAVQQESLDTILLLLEAGCRTDAVDKYGTSVELLAKGRANKEISFLLNQWAPQNNIEITSEKKESLFEVNQNPPITQSIPLTSIIRQSPVPQFNNSKKVVGTNFSEAKQSELGQFKNEPTQKETTLTTVSNEQSDNDSEWGSNSEAEGGQSQNEGTFNADLKKRISQTFLLPVPDDKAANIFKSTKKAVSNVSPLLTSKEIETDGTVGREGTMKDAAETLVRNSTSLKETDDDEKSTNARDEETNLPQTLEERISKTDSVLENKMSVFSALKDREIISEDQKNSTDNIHVKDKLTDMSHDQTNLNQESDISEWSNSDEDKNENINKIQNKDSSISDVDVDNILSLIDKHNLPPKPKVLKPVEETTDSENDSSWDSDVGSPLKTNMKIRSDVARLEKDSSVEPEVKVLNMISSINEDLKGLQADANPINQNFLVQENDEDEDGLSHEVIKGWVGVMSELTEKVSSSKMLTSITDSGLKNARSTVSESLPSTANEDQLLYSHDSHKSLNIENENIPPGPTLSSQTCQITSSEIFGEVESSPDDKIAEELQDIAENDEMSTIFARHKSNSIDSGAGLLNTLGKPNTNLNSPLEAEGSNTIVPTLLTIPKLLDKANAKKNKNKAKSEKSLIAASHSIPLSSLLNDDVETLKKKMSKRSYFNPLRFSHGKSDTVRKLSCPESNVPPSFLSKMKTQFSMKKPSLGKSGSLPDVTAAHLQDMKIEESDQIVCELLKKAKEILLSTAANRTKDVVLKRKMSHGDYQRDTENDSSNEGDGCCDEQYPGLQGTYRSFQQPVLPLTSTRYCDSVSPNDPDPFVLKEVIKDLSCVIEKTYGNNASLRGRSNDLECELERLQKELKCCECCKEELQSELLKLQADFSQAQYALDELAEGKRSLETILTQLRAQVLRQEELLNCGSREKSCLSAKVKELEMKVKEYGEGISQLQAERDDLVTNYQTLDEMYNNTTTNENFKIAELQESLARCCQQNQSFQEEINHIRNEINEIRIKAENLQFEKRRMMNEFERARQCALNEKASLESIIADLQRRLGLCEEQKKDNCQKMNEIVSAHHIEMDKLIEEATKYKGICECMNEELETLRKKLRDCEEQKRNNGHHHNMSCESEAILAEKIATYERLKYQTETLNQQNSHCVEFGEEKFRTLRSELKSEQEQMEKLKHEFHLEKEQWGIIKEQMDKDCTAKDAEIRNFQMQLEEQKSQFEDQILTLKNDREQLLSQIHPLEQSNDVLKQEVEKLTEDIQLYDADMVKSKDLLEVELKNLKAAIESQHAEARNKQEAAEVEKLKDEQMEELKYEFDQAKEQWNKVKEQMDKDSKASDAEILKLQKLLDDQKFQFEDQNSNWTSDRERLLNEMVPLGQSNDELKLEVRRLTEEIQLYDVEKHTLVNVVKSKDRLEVEVMNLKSAIDDQHAEAQNQQELAQVQGDLAANLRHEFDQAKDQWRILKEQIDKDSKASETEIRKLQDQLEAQQSQFEEQISTLKNNRALLLDEILRQGQSNDALNREVKKLTEEIQLHDAEKTTLLNMVKSKERLEGEVKNLKRAIEDQHAEARYQQETAEDDKLLALKSELKSERELVANLRHKFDQAEFEKWEDKFRALRSELKSERELSANLRRKFDQAKEQWSIFRGQIDKDSEASGPEIMKLQNQLEEQKSQFEDQISTLKNDREHLRCKIRPLEKSNDVLKREVNKLTEEIQLYDAEKIALLNMVKSKDRLEVELKNLKRAIDDQHAEEHEQESAEIEKWKDKFRALRSELKAERELVAKLKHKFDQAKEQWSIFKEKMDRDSKASAPKIRKLESELEEQKLQFENQISKLKNDREHLLSEILRQGQSVDALKRELKKLTEEIQLYDAEKNTLLNMVKSKDRLEVELKSLKRAIDDQYVDKTELERLKSAYDMQIATVKSQYEQQVQLGIDRKYSEITQIMDKQARDRTMIDQIRESNENILRTELSTTKKSSQMEIYNLKRLIREKEEQIKSEISSRRLITEKFSVEKRRNEDLLRKLSLLSTARSETLLAFNTNANNLEDT